MDPTKLGPDPVQGSPIPCHLPMMHNLDRHEQPQPARFRLLGIAAFGASAASCAAAIGATCLWLDQARFLDGQPPGAISGGMAFNLNLAPLVTNLVTILIGFAGLILLLASCGYARFTRQRVLTGLHIATALLLLPAVILVVKWSGPLSHISSF